MTASVRRALGFQVTGADNHGPFGIKSFTPNEPGSVRPDQESL